MRPDQPGGDDWGTQEFDGCLSLPLTVALLCLAAWKLARR
jgi:hypothetical protein